MRKWIFCGLMLVMFTGVAPVEPNDSNINTKRRSTISPDSQIYDEPLNTSQGVRISNEVALKESVDSEQPVVLVSMWIDQVGQSVVDDHPQIQQSVTIAINGDLGIDFTQLILNIQYVTSPDYNGYLCLDREGQWIESLESDPDSSAFQQAMTEGIQTLELVQAMRPNAKVGYYALPFRAYFNRDAAWIERAMNILPLLDMQDVLFPCVYDFYDDETVVMNSVFESGMVGNSQDMQYVFDNVRLALMLAGDKPVIPYVWQRFHPADNPPTHTAYQLIDDEQFAVHVSQVMVPEVNGRRAAGVCMWDASPYFFNLDLIPEDVPDYLTSDTYFDAMAAHYICLIARNILNASCSHPLPDNEDCDGNGVANYVEIINGVVEDCNANSKPDFCDLADSPEMDLDQSGYLDSCQALTDVNGDGIQNILDLIAMIDFWGLCPGVSPRCLGDINEDSTVDIRDMLLLINAWE